jgi:hypothetical protein
MNLFKELDKKWRTINQLNNDLLKFEKLDKKLLINPVDSFPEKRILSKKQIIQLQKHEEKGGNWSGEEFLEMCQLKTIRGITSADFLFITEELEKIKGQAADIGIKIPKWFVFFFENRELINRFRVGCFSFFIYEGIVSFPNYEDYYLIPFFGDSQGYSWWHILINSKSEYRIVYRNYHWNEEPEEHEPKEAGTYYICSDTFEEFLIRLSIEQIQMEKKFSSKNIE